MTDDHSAARDVIAEFLDGCSVVDITDDRQQCATALIAALTAAGYEITRRDPAAGRVAIPIATLKEIVNTIDELDRFQLAQPYTEATTG